MSRPDAFSRTHWTVVLAARGNDTAAGEALSLLCAAYYEPVVAFLRREGRPDDAARDLAHSFFAAVLAGRSLAGADPARGRFRSYLLGALKHFLRDHHARLAAGKRGAGVPHVSIDDTAAGIDPGSADPDADLAYDRQWALTVIARALDAVKAEMTRAGRLAQFEALQPWITGDAAVPHAEIAARLGLTEGAAKVAIHRLRVRFRAAVRAEIVATLAPGDDPDAELRHLVAVLAAC